MSLSLLVPTRSLFGCGQSHDVMVIFDDEQKLLRSERLSSGRDRHNQSRLISVCRRAWPAAGRGPAATQFAVLTALANKPGTAEHLERDNCAAPLILFDIRSNSAITTGDHSPQRPNSPQNETERLPGAIEQGALDLVGAHNDASTQISTREREPIVDPTADGRSRCHGAPRSEQCICGKRMQTFRLFVPISEWSTIGSKLHTTILLVLLRLRRPCMIAYGREGFIHSPERQFQEFVSKGLVKIWAFP